MPKMIRVRDLPGMGAFFDAVAALLDTVNAERENVPAVVHAAADRVRAEAMGIGNGPEIAVDEAERTPGQLAAEAGLRTAMNVARENPNRVVNVTWFPED